jgi:predicted nucleotidyltransferase
MDASINKKISDYFATQPVLKAWVFGSYARGEEREDSDIDLLVQLDESQRIGIRFFGMYADLKEILGREVDLVAEGCLMPFAEESANRDKKLIYERARA